MSLFSVIKVELLKLWHKKSTCLLLLLFAPAILFGVGMSVGLSFFVSDGADSGVNAVGNALSGLGFAVNMIEQSEFLLYLIVIILAAFSFSGELESGQLKSEILKVCGRGKILIGKFVSLLFVIFGTLFACILWALIIYAVLPLGERFASGVLFDSNAFAQLEYILFTLLGIATVTVFTLLLGTRLKSFACFALAYILWFASLYTDFMGKLKYLIPFNMPGAVLSSAVDLPRADAYAALYTGYVAIIMVLANVIFRKEDIKT